MDKIKISNRSRQHVRELLYKYAEMKSDIAAIRESILYPYKQEDENIGGGKSSFPIFESDKAIKLASHSQIEFRAKAISAIDHVLGQANDEAQKIIELKYFSKDPHSWVSISQHEDINYTEDGCRKVERKIVDTIAQKLGW